VQQQAQLMPLLQALMLLLLGLAMLALLRSRAGRRLAPQQQRQQTCQLALAAMWH
jgi:hypothetical protein